MKGQVSASWSHAILVCRKCSKKMKGGFGKKGKQRLAKVLRKRLDTKKGRRGRVGVVEVPCLDVCPKRAVMLVDSRQPGVWHVVRPDADLDALVASVGGEGE